MNSSEVITEDKLLKENKTKNDKARHSIREVNDEREDVEAFCNPDLKVVIKFIQSKINLRKGESKSG
ncbi:MAG TPA: hypothetical protein VEL70_02480 [Candidatus Acidoferrum sp.]|nr:hypothetical protein [Candidatus Acidoferrum sp.]